MNVLKQTSGLIVAGILIGACGTAVQQESPSEDSIATAIAQTQEAQASISEPETEDGEAVTSVELLPPATNTPLPPPSPVPATETPVPTAEFTPDERWARNYLGGQDSGGVVIEVVRVVVANKSAIPDQPFDELNDYVEGWAEINVVGEILFKVTNNSDRTANVYPDQGTLQIGAEQIELFDYALFMSVGEDTSGEIFPGVTKIGGLWFGIKRSTPGDVQQMIFRASNPSDENFDSMGPDYEIVLDVSEHAWEEIPDELR